MAFSRLTRKILKRAYYRNYCNDSDQILHSVKTTKCPSEVAYTSASQIRDGGHLRFLNFEILMIGMLKRVELRHPSKFRGDRSNRCRDMAIFRFLGDRL